MSLVSLRPRVEQLVRASNAGIEIDLDAHLREAALVYSRRRPRVLVRDVVSAGGWSLPLPEEWVPGFSRVSGVEYPVGFRPRAMLTSREYDMYQTPDGDELQLRDETLVAGATVRLTITTPHVLDEDGTTLPPTCWDTVLKLAAGNACLEISAHYTHTQDVVHGLDSVSHGTKGSEFAKRGRDYLAAAESELPELKAESRAAAGGSEISFAGEIGFLSH